MDKIYLDYNATTPVLPEISDVMKIYLTEKWGNPSSPHWGGEGLKEDIEIAREKIAESLNCRKEDVFFTSCGTESNNWALKSAVNLFSGKKHIITTKVEHPAVIEPCKFLEKQGIDVTYLEVNEKGELDLEMLEKSVKEETVLISVMMANNETGVLFPVKEIGKIAQKYGVLFHIDGVQAYGKTKVDLNETGADFFSISGHKVYAPKGIGCLIIRNKQIEPLLHGGGQEKGLRSGTENVASIVALGKAAEIITEDYRNNYFAELRDKRAFIEYEITKHLSPVEIHGIGADRICNTSNVSFKNIVSTALIKALASEGIAVSAGSACASGKDSYSHVLEAMGKSKTAALSSIRISLGKGLTDEMLEYAVKKIIFWVKKLRYFSPEKF
jgi:cysteine desulfurase